MNKTVRKMATTILLVCSVLLTTACGRTTENYDANGEMQRKETEKISYKVYEKPTYALDENMLTMFLFSHGDLPEYLFKMKASKNIEYHSSKMQPDGTWESGKVNWNDSFADMEKRELQCMLSDSKGNLYGIAMDEKGTNCDLYRIGSDGTIEMLNTDSAKKKFKNKVLYTIAYVTDSKLILTFSEPDDMIGENVSAIEYDLIAEKVIGDTGKVRDSLATFDENGLYYYPVPGANVEDGVILAKSIYSSNPEKTIKCKYLLNSHTQILVKDGFGYIMTRWGICGGRLDDKEWDIVIPVEEMYIPKCFTNEEQAIMPSDAIMCMVKTSGDDREFFCMTWKDEKHDDFSWVHYYDEK